MKTMRCSVGVSGPASITSRRQRAASARGPPGWPTSSSIRSGVMPRRFTRRESDSCTRSSAGWLRGPRAARLCRDATEAIIHSRHLGERCLVQRTEPQSRRTFPQPKLQLVRPFRAEVGMRSRDRHLGKVVVFVHLVPAGPLECRSVRQSPPCPLRPPAAVGRSTGLLPLLRDPPTRSAYGSVDNIL